MRGFKNFKGFDASGPSMYSYSMAQLVQLSLFHSYSHASAEYLPVEQLDVAQQWNYLKDNVI